MKNGFTTPDGYATVPWGNRLVILYDGEQLADVNTLLQATKFIQQHRANSQSGTVFV
jgi:hypothetical protein